MWKTQALNCSLICALILAPSLVRAGPFAGVEADVFILGETHDNGAHHAAQAEAIRDTAPRAVVFEMLTAAQAREVRDDRLDDPEALAELLDWESSGWPDFALYYPIFAEARGAMIVGAAVPRPETRAAMETGIVAAFGPEADTYGLTEELEAEELAQRLNLQLEAHCGALPTTILPAMVDIQRLRDATLARAVVRAHGETGGPVAVITGNGHARRDWGVPAYLARVAPELTVRTMGQSEDGQMPDGGFDVILDAPAADREDPCAAFR